MDLPLEITPAEVVRRRKAGEALTLLDVREAQELAIARIEGSEWVPMNAVPASLSRLETLADDSLLVVFCHHGVRSLNVAAWLRNQGLSNCTSLAGGIDRWSREVDPAVGYY